MIPKVIHYCWFGGNPKNDIIQKCIDSWKKFCPDYEIIEWNESNFDVNMTNYTRDAYLDKKYAFVSDFARLWIIYNNGGFYLDTDVLLRNSLDELCKYDCWFAQDDINYIATGLGFGAVKGHEIIKKLADRYFEYTYPCGTNVILDTAFLEANLSNWKKSTSSQIVDGIYIMYYEYRKYAWHLYTSMCSTKSDEEVQKRADLIRNRLNRTSTRKERFAWRIRVFIRNPRLINYFSKHKGTFLSKLYYFIAYDLIEYGPIYYIKRFIKK